MEHAYAALNLSERISNVDSMIAPFSNWGDLGAATGIALISMIIEDGVAEKAKGPYNLILASSLGKSRACALLELPM